MGGLRIVYDLLRDHYTEMKIPVDEDVQRTIVTILMNSDVDVVHVPDGGRRGTQDPFVVGDVVSAVL